MTAYLLNNRNTHHSVLYSGVFLQCFALFLLSDSLYSSSQVFEWNYFKKFIWVFVLGTVCVVYYIVDHCVSYLRQSPPHLIIYQSGIVFTKGKHESLHIKHKYRIPWEKIQTITITDSCPDPDSEIGNGPYLIIDLHDNSNIVFPLGDYKWGYNSYQMIRALKYYSGRNDIFRSTRKHLWLITVMNPFVNSIKTIKP